MNLPSSLCFLGLVACLPLLRQEQAAEPEAGALSDPGVWLDAEQGLVGLRASVLIKEDLLEYLLVAPNGAAHESLFLTDVSPTLLNAMLLGAGAEAGSNARWEEVDPEDVEEGARPYRVLEPEGPPEARFLPYVAWREDGETYFFRVEDVLTNLATGRSMRRHPWIYLGSRMASMREGEPQRFLAEVEGNLINVAFFFEGNTLLTASLEACSSQTIWVGNQALLPPRETPVVLLFAREPLQVFPPAWEAHLEPAKADGD